MEWSEHDQRGKGNPCEDTCIKNSRGCCINGIMKTVENKALMRIYRKDLTLPSGVVGDESDEPSVPARLGANSHHRGVAPPGSRSTWKILLEGHYPVRPECDVRYLCYIGTERLYVGPLEDPR